MGILFGFAPWIVYWVLVGNVPFVTAVLVAFVAAIAAFVIARASGSPGRTLEIGAVATFFVLSVLTFSGSQAFMERWIQPLSAWRKMGVKTVGGAPVPSSAVQASLVRAGTRSFLLYSNYDAILGYNCAHTYALSVALLSDRMK